MGQKLRLSNLDLPPDIVHAATNYREMPAAIRPMILKTVEELKQQHHDTRQALAWEWNRGNRHMVQEELRPIEGKIKACQGLLSALRKIPPDVLARIFEFYVASGDSDANTEYCFLYDIFESDEWTDDEHDMSDSRPRPSLLCFVCRHWNAVAIATPSLWENIRFTIGAQEQKPGKHPLVEAGRARRIATWMNRTTPRPWSLVIDAKPEEYGPYRDESEGSVQLSKLLKGPALQQLERVSIKSDPFSLGMGDVTLPNVVSAVIYSEAEISSVKKKKAVILPDLPTLPALTHAVLEGVFPPRALPLHLPWSQLTHLYIGETVPMRPWQAIFKLCTSLQKGCFSLFDFDSNDMKNKVVYPEPITATLPHLTELVFLHSSPFGDRGVRGVDMPALQVMKLFPDEEYMDCFWNSSSPSNFRNLTHLTLVADSGLPGSTAVRVLRTVPFQLQELFIIVSSQFDELFNFLTFRQNGKSLPFLKALGLYIKTLNFNELDNYGSDDEADEADDQVEIDFPYESLSTLVASRTQAIQEGTISSPHCTLSKLKQLVIHACDVRQRSHAVVRKLEESVLPFVKYDLNAFVFTMWPHNKPTGMRRKAGRAPEIFGHYKHWDEGFMKAVDDIEEYSLYPTSGRLEVC